jgi:hypothetical protein
MIACGGTSVSLQSDTVRLYSPATRNRHHSWPDLSSIGPFEQSHSQEKWFHDGPNLHFLKEFVKDGLHALTNSIFHARLT